MKKIVAINASPRTSWNTATLIREAAKGAASEGAETEIIDLYKLGNFTGCISCFGCKREPNIGKCICKDELAYVLEAIRNADGVIIGSPVYIGNLTAAFRALYERLIFQYITYKTEPKSYSKSNIPVLLVITSNAPEESFDKTGYNALFEDYRRSLNHFIGPAKTLVYSNTLQVNDYEKYDWTMFDVESKKSYNEKALPQKKQEAFDLGKRMLTEEW